jgi:hypothetical protein
LLYVFPGLNFHLCTLFYSKNTLEIEVNKTIFLNYHFLKKNTLESLPLLCYAQTVLLAGRKSALCKLERNYSSGHLLLSLL